MTPVTVPILSRVRPGLCNESLRRPGRTRLRMGTVTGVISYYGSMSLFQDLRFGVRMLAKDPGFTAVVVVTLALGIGANTTVFTLANAVLFKGLPFDQPDRIMHLSSNNLSKGRDRMG